MMQDARCNARRYSLSSWLDLMALDLPVSSTTAGSSGSPSRETWLPRFVVMVVLVNCQ